MKVLLLCIFGLICVQISFSAQVRCSCDRPEAVNQINEKNDFCDVNYIGQIVITDVVNKPGGELCKTEGSYISCVLREPSPTVYFGNVLQDFKKNYDEPTKMQTVSISQPDYACELKLKKDQSYIIAGNRTGSVIVSADRCNLWNMQQTEERLNNLKSSAVVPQILPDCCVVESEIEMNVDPLQRGCDNKTEVMGRVCLEATCFHREPFSDCSAASAYHNTVDCCFGMGCMCKPPYLRQPDGGKCVLADLCPLIDPFPV